MQESQHSRQMREEWEVTKKASCLETRLHSEPPQQPPMFRNLPRAMHASWKDDQATAVPDGYFGAEHCNTKWLLTVLSDTADTRLLRLLKQGRTRVMFQSDVYFQLWDQPSMHIKSYRMDKPMFHSKALLFMNAFGIAMYLHKYNALKQLTRQKKGEASLINWQQASYAAFVNDHSTGDVIRFTYEYIMLKREAYKAIPFLLEIGWEPSSPSVLVYRRRYFQYVTPFTDWVDVCRNVLRSKPSLQLSKVMQELVQARSPQFKLDELMVMGEVMVEHYEVKELKKDNFQDEKMWGQYAARKLVHNKDTEVPRDYAAVFNEVVRPVVPHAVSAARRFLCYTYYYDFENLTTLSQILSVTEIFQQNRYFSCDTDCKDAKWSNEPLLFQISEILNLRYRGELLRRQNWSNTISCSGIVCWYRRFDIMNCIALVFGILQNCLLKNFSSTIIDRICRLLLQMFCSSELIEPFLSYSVYDAYHALCSLVNNVPNLHPSCVMRVMTKAPMLLTKLYTLPQITEMFSDEFWRSGWDGNFWDSHEMNLGTVGEFLVLRKRRMSISELSIDNSDTGSKNSQADYDTILIFTRKKIDMKDVTQAQEEAKVTEQVHNTHKSSQELEHMRWYKRVETDFRYHALFKKDFDNAMARPNIILDEKKTLADNIKSSAQPQK